MDALDASSRSGLGTEELFLADSRLALAALNVGRKWALRRVFGVSREQANLLTLVLALSAAEAAHEATRRVIRAPLRVSGTDAAIGGFLVREAALGIAGPRNRDVPLFGTLMMVAAIAGLALPGLRRAVQGFRATEQRVREQRISRYIAARRAYGS